MSFVDSQDELFKKLTQSLFQDLKNGEELNVGLNAEDSLYVRFHNAQVRQNTQVEQSRLNLTFQKGNRRLTMATDTTGDAAADLEKCRWLLERARKEFEILPEDPGVTPLENRGSSQTMEEAAPFDFDALMKTLQTQAEGTDFTGLLAAGPQIVANANSKGQSHWFSTRSFFLDYSLFTVNQDQENKAVSRVYADKEWSQEKFMGSLGSAKNQLALLRRPSRDVRPGGYRVFMAPSAVAELIQIMSWGALSYGAYKKGACAFAKLADKQIRFSPKFHLRENFELGLTTPFNSLGELPPRQLDLIKDGELKNFLVSSRSSREFGMPSNAAGDSGWGSEVMRSPELLGGTLATRDALKALGTGLYLSNLHYLNWSDLVSARVTGMTRYACFWVENGEIAAPIRDLRFDTSLFQVFGEDLVDLTREQEVQPETSTYFERALGGKLVPGMLLSNFEFTL